MTLVGGNIRRLWLALLAFTLAMGVVSFVPTSSADAAYPGGNDWLVFADDVEDEDVAGTERVRLDRWQD